MLPGLYCFIPIPYILTLNFTIYQFADMQIAEQLASLHTWSWTHAADWKDDLRLRVSNEQVFGGWSYMYPA